VVFDDSRSAIVSSGILADSVASYEMQVRCMREATVRLRWNVSSTAEAGVWYRTIHAIRGYWRLRKPKCQCQQSLNAQPTATATEPGSSCSSSAVTNLNCHLSSSAALSHSHSHS